MRFLSDALACNSDLIFVHLIHGCLVQRETCVLVRIFDNHMSLQLLGRQSSALERTTTVG